MDATAVRVRVERELGARLERLGALNERLQLGRALVAVQDVRRGGVVLGHQPPERALYLAHAVEPPVNGRVLWDIR